MRIGNFNEKSSRVLYKKQKKKMEKCVDKVHR